MSREDLKNLLLSFKQEDFYKNVDLHIHSKESDGKLDAVEILEQAKNKGLKYISISDHNCIDAYLNTNILSCDMVIPAVEFDCFFKGTLMHILGYGIDIDNKELKQFYAKTKSGKTYNLVRLFQMRSPKEVIEAIKKANGIAVLAHPACCWALSLENLVKDLVNFGLDGIEVYYPYNGLRGILKFYSKEYVFELAEKYNLIKTGGTDSHGKVLLD